MLNIMNEKDLGRIWIPTIVFENSPKRIFIKSESLSSISVKREEKAIKKFSFELNEYEEFQGAENAIVFENTYELQLTCLFDFHFYPFDIQLCRITVSTKNCKTDRADIANSQNIVQVLS